MHPHYQIAEQMPMAQPLTLDASKFKAFPNAAAGHDGVMSDESGEIFIKPCTQAEVDFYQDTLLHHSEFSELIPVFMGSLQIGDAMTNIAAAAGNLPTDAVRIVEETQQNIVQTSSTGHLRGKPIPAEIAIILENLEHGFVQPNVIDIKLGSRLYADGTLPDKAARLDKVAAETTSGSLNFRITGMKVWNGQQFEIYDKLYGRSLNASDVVDGFVKFFSGLTLGTSSEEQRQVVEGILAEVMSLRHCLEDSESRMFGTSLLIIYEGDSGAMRVALESAVGKARKQEPESAEIEAEHVAEADESEDEDDVQVPATHRVKMIDFAHSAWTPQKGPDANVIAGLKNVEEQLRHVMGRFM